MSPPLSDDEYRLFAEWLVQEYGLQFGPEKREILRARLEPRRAELNLPSFERLLFHVRYHPDRERERLRLLTHLTNNESYFFRERKQLEALGGHVIPALVPELRERGRSSVRILSAGSASGEEPFTLAIVARQALAGTGVAPEITGVDLDIKALERAREAVYRTHAFRGVEDHIRERHFRQEPDGRWRLNGDLRDAARFRQGNIVDPGWGTDLPPQDVVFCRNVMIYFDDAAVKRAVANLHRVLRPGGYLFLGHAETLSRVPTPFVPVRRPGTVYYQRPKE